jgi:hypothetical protein
VTVVENTYRSGGTKELHSVALDKDGTAELDYSLTAFTHAELRLELHCEDGMVYIYPLYHMGWEYGRHENDAHFYSNDNSASGQLWARFPDDTELNLRLHR